LIYQTFLRHQNDLGETQVKSTYWYLSQTPQLMGDIAEACEVFFNKEKS
jgi:hypothetical protein